VSALLALLASVIWGVADFLGGALSRRVPTIAVVLLSLTGSLITDAVILSGGGWHAPGTYLWWGVLSGVSGTLGVALFYRALAIGTMSVVAPIAATGIVVPVVYGLATGDHPSIAQGVGIVLAGAGVILASGPELRLAGTSRRSVWYAVGAAFAFGWALTSTDRGSRTSVAMTVTANAVVGLVLGLAYVAATRSSLRVSRSMLFTLLGLGVLNVAALGTFGFAARGGLVSVVSVLGSLYPVVTVLLAMKIYRERLVRIQTIGVVGTLVGVVLLAL
jgi:uncharacterized membrane protein